MSGTKAGGLKAAAKNREKYGEDFYSNIGRKAFCVRQQERHNDGARLYMVSIYPTR